MIISHKYKFIFLHVPKTGGSSISTFLSQYLGREDIFNGWHHSLRKGIPYNYKTLDLVNNKFGLKMISKAINMRKKDNKLFERPIIEFALREVLKKKIGTNSRHASAKLIKKYDKKSWDKYFKFTFVRNPYTCAISNWLWDEKKWSILNDNKINRKKLTREKFTNYLIGLKRKIKDNKNYHYHKLPGNKIYTIDNQIAVDYVAKFENINSEILKIKKILKLPKEKFKFEQTKKNSTKKHLKYYTKESKKLVEEIWKKEFELFKYKFPKN